jgi:hypothetical protein
MHNTFPNLFNTYIDMTLEKSKKPSNYYKDTVLVTTLIFDDDEVIIRSKGLFALGLHK